MSSRLVQFLLVEDDDDHAELVLRNFRRSRVANAIDRAQNGEEALAYLAECDGIKRAQPDVVLLDLKLPGMQGLELLERIKTTDDLKSIPVVILTTSNNEADRARAYRSHANSYLVKPLTFNRFRDLVNDLNLYWGVWNERPANGDQRNGQ